VIALATLAGLAALAYAAIALTIFLLQDRLVYFPTREIEGTPRDVGLDYEDVRIETSDGLALHGWWVPAEEARGALLFMHGNAGNVSHRLHSLRLLHDLRLDVLIFDYRGYGRSEGRPTERGTYLDARAAWDTLVARGVAPERVVLFGRSLGGAIAAALATEVTPVGLVVESTFTSVPALGARIYRWLPVRTLARIHYDTAARLERYHGPVLIVHSDADEVVPYAHGRELYERAHEPKRLLTIGGAHADGYMTSGARYRDGLDDFLSEVL
jgi:uncharacterized protein